MPYVLFVIFLVFMVLTWGFWKIVFAGLLIAVLGPFAFVAGIFLMVCIVAGIAHWLGAK